MRTPFLAAALGLGLAGCLVGDAGTAAGGDDDGNGSQGSNGSSGSNGSNSNAKVDVTIDKTAISTELKTNNPVNITVAGSGGFAGDVALSATVVDTAGAAIPGWTVEFSEPTVTLSANGTGTSVATLKIPAKNTGLGGVLKITGASAATSGTNLASATVTVLNQVTFAVKVDPATNACIYPTDGGNTASPVQMSLGTKVRFFNTGTVNLVIHSGGVISHQGQAPNGLADPTTEPSTAYEQMPTGAGAASWYCHAPGKDLSAANPRFSVQ
jgi:hypothetical protein